MKTAANNKKNVPQSPQKKPVILRRDLGDKIAKRAYIIWQKRGCAHGHDMTDWLQAEREVEREYDSM